MEVHSCVLVIKETAFSGGGRAAHFARQGHKTAHRILHAHDEHYRTADAVRSELTRRGIKFLELTPRSFTAAAKKKIGAADLIITVGGDGTVLHTSHYVTRGAILAVNSAPRDSVGHFCSAHRGTFREKLDAVLRDAIRPISLARLEVSLDGRTVPELALNDVLITHESPAATTRYIIEIDGKSEEHRSSGIWISTAVGSTAGIRSAGGKVLPLGSRRFQYLVRELYRPHGQTYDLKKGILGPSGEIHLASKMPEGLLFIDGSRTMYEFPFGMAARIRVADIPLRIFPGRSGRT